MNTITTKEAREKLASAKETKGQFFGVYFTPRNSDEEKIVNGKAGVREGIKGVGKRYSDKLHGLVTVWGRNRDRFTSIPLEGVHKITMNGEVYRVKPSKETLLTGWGLKPLFG